jgi:hypothetical protein
VVLKWTELAFLIEGFCIPAATVILQDGHLWHVRDLYQTAGLVAIVIICFVALLVSIKVAVSMRVAKSGVFSAIICLKYGFKKTYRFI